MSAPEDVDGLLARLADLAARPLEAATAMPPGVYLSEELHRLERERIFAREWICVGRAAEIPSPGDYLTYSINDQPLFVIRGRDGGVRAFANVCRHRMMRLLQGSGTCRQIVCPYHGWTYGIDGQLRGAPHMAGRPGFDPRQIRLPEIRTELWEGWIYATLDPDAESLATRLAPLLEVVGRYRMADYVPVARQDHLWDTNWKLLTENFMESYHLPIAHRETVGAWLPVNETAFPDAVYEAFTYETFTKRPDAEYGLAHASNTVLEGPWRRTSVMPTVFPTHMYVLAPDHLWYLLLRPEGTGRVHVRFGAAVAPEVMAERADKDAFIRDTVAFFDKVNAEDRFVVEGIYQGARAPLSEPGPLSWLEREIHDFIKYLVRRLAGEAAVPLARARGRAKKGGQA